MVQMKRIIRPSRTLVPLIQAVLTLPCVLLLVVLQALAMVSVAPARQCSGATLEHLVRELATQFARQNEQVYFPRKLHGIHAETASRTTECMRKHDARANDIDKSLDSLREGLDALQSASVSSVETKSVALPKVAGLVGSGSNGRPYHSHTPGESAGSAQPLGKRQKPSISPSQKAPEEWYQQDDEFQ